MVVLEETGGFMEKPLISNLDILKKNIVNDWDFWLVVDGLERTGKSTLAIQVGKYLDPSLDLKRICFTPEQFDRAIDDAPKYSCVIWDEAVTGAESIDLTKMAVTLKRKAVQIGQKNLFIILVIHSFFELKKYYAIHRTWFLLHTDWMPNKRNDLMDRGNFAFYDFQKKKTMYCYDWGRRNFIYTGKPNFKGHFPKKLPIDDAEYRKKKLDAISKKAEGMPELVFAKECIKRGIGIPMLLKYCSLSDTYLYSIKKELELITPQTSPIKVIKEEKVIKEDAE